MMYRPRLGQWEDEGAWEVLGDVVVDEWPSWEPPPAELPWEPLSWEPEPQPEERSPPQDVDERPPPQDEPARDPFAAFRAIDRADDAASMGPLVTWYTPGPSGEQVEGAIDRFMATGGSVDRALMSIQQARRMGDSEALRDAEHALASQYTIDTLGPVGYVVVAVTVPTYSAAKWVAQTIPGADVLAALSPVPLTRQQGASTPSWNEIWWGLRPLWGTIR